MHVFLDERNPKAFHQLKAHPNCRVTVCDEAHWLRLVGRRPEKHQARQSQNATLAYRRAHEVDWLMHLDVDEFLVSEQSLAKCLAQLPAECLTVRVRPIEALAHPQDTTQDPSAFKAFLPNGPDRVTTVLELYPTFGAYVKGGFVSHVAGKVFVRTGQEVVSLRIHNAFVGPEKNPGSQDLAQVALAHCHAKNWQDWYAQHTYRHEKGSYREDLAPAIPRDAGGLTLHELFQVLIEDQGTAGLRTFFNEICADTPEHRAKLEARGLLRLHNLGLKDKLATHFPDFAE